jgi:hypothetical protein
MMEGDHPGICTHGGANKDNGSIRAGQPNCIYFQTRPEHHKGLEALENRIDTITFGIDADLVEESNRMWRGRLAMACLVLVIILDIGYLFWSLL